MRALVFDDDAISGYALGRFVAAAGMEAITVTDGASFRSHVLSHSPDIILLDLRLGETDGVDELRLLSEQSYAGSIILISGLAQGILNAAADMAKKRHLHIAAALRKPVDTAELLRVLMLHQDRKLQISSTNRERIHTERLSADEVLAGLRNDQMSIILQPVVSRHPHSVGKFEALARWKHPQLGNIPPSEFIPLAEADQTCLELLTERVIDRTIDSILRLHRHDIQIPISVNFSARSLYDTSLPDQLAARLKSAGIPPGQFGIEMTERVVVHNLDATREVLLQMQLRGIPVALDDFGTGHSSLIALRHLPFSEIKIDRSFVADMNVSRASFAIVRSIIRLAAEIGATSVAEGVEREETAQLLEDIGVNGLQGYLFSAGMKVEAVPEWHAAWTAIR